MNFMDIAFAVFIGGGMLASAGVGGLIARGPSYRQGFRDGSAEREHIDGIHALCSEEPAPYVWPGWDGEALAELPAQVRPARASWVQRAAIEAGAVLDEGMSLVSTPRAIGRAHVPHPLSLPVEEADRTPWTVDHPKRKPVRHAAEPDDALTTTTGEFWAIVKGLQDLGIEVNPLALPCTHCDGADATHAGCPGCSCPCTLVAVTP